MRMWLQRVLGLLCVYMLVYTCVRVCMCMCVCACIIIGRYLFNWSVRNDAHGLIAIAFGA